MNFTARRFIALLPLTSLALFSFALTGCGGSDRPAVALASGIVKLDGIPMAGATVTFIPKEGGRPGSGMTDAEGRYTIKTYEDAEGGIVGEHKVAVMKVGGAGAFAMVGEGGDATVPNGDESGENDGSDGLSQLEETETKSSEQPTTIYFIPQKYINPETSGLRMTVPSEGSDALNLDLTR